MSNMNDLLLENERSMNSRLDWLDRRMEKEEAREETMSIMERMGIIKKLSDEILDDEILDAEPRHRIQNLPNA